MRVSELACKINPLDLSEREREMAHLLKIFFSAQELEIRFLFENEEEGVRVIWESRGSYITRFFVPVSLRGSLINKILKKVLVLYN